MPTAIDIDSITVYRGRALVLDRLSCRVPSGQVTGLLGPSGSGKTTLMRAVVGVQEIRDGGITVLDLPAGDRRLRPRLGYVTQSPSVYLDLTVTGNVEYFATVYGQDTAAARRAIADVGLSAAAGRHAADLSGGELARASLACALVARPEVLVLDEPTVGLDPVLREELWQRFHQLADAGTTLLVSSHVMDEAARCTRLLLLREGRLIADDTPQGIRDATGNWDLEQAFLRLVRDIEGGG